MRKSILLTVCFVAVVSILRSAPVDTMTCMRVASNFYRERAATQQTRSASPVLAKTYKALPSNARDSVNCLYIYNVGDGYVIVSADDRITPVVGYSTEGNFDAQRMPIQLQEWLSQYAAAIGAAVSSPTFTNEAVISSWRALASDNYTPTRYGTVVAGPLMDTHWNQSPRYNNYCPYNDSVGARTITGCVATAMAQLIRYWQYPSQGIGSYSYVHPRYGTLTANFGNTTYNYNLMPLQLTSSSSAAEINEVAKLMYHCGVSVNMDYGLGSPYDGGSGASSSRAAYALNTFFGYSGCQYELRSNYSDSQWLNKLKQELNNARPVFYDGSGTGGHAFICDGYTVDNYFHFNFGWGGYLDGYFLIDNITPGSNNFNNNQGAIFNVTAALPILRASETAFDYLIESGTYSEGKKVNIITHHLSDPISVTTSSPFAVSTDSIHYSHSLSLDTVGGAFYVRYEPATGIHSDVSQVTISSGSLSVSVSLSGNTYMLNCIPVQDLNIVSSDLQHINLSWTRPQIDTTSQILTWNEGLYSYYSFPSDSNKFILLQRFAESDLVPYHNKSLTGITFFVPDGLTSLKLLVYVGGSYASSFNPGTQVVEQTIPVGTLTFNAWNTFTLSNPVAIDASQELCFGVYMTSTANYPIPIGSTHVSKKSFILGYTSASGSSGWYEPSNFNVAVRARIQNTQSVTHYEVSRDGTLLGSTTSPSYNDIVSHTDTYHYTVTAYWDNGCSADASLDFTNVASITANPRVLEFHNNYGYSNTIKTVQVNGNGITQPIQISVTGNFRVSTNGTTFSTSTTMAAAGGTLYVKYVPTSVSTSLETGTINITTGTLSASVALYGQCHNDCLPPENLSLSSSGSTVNLSWNTPTVTPAAPSTLSWCSTISSVRYGSGTKATMVHRYATSDLTQLSNRALTSISFATYNISTVTKCTVVVYKGGSYTGSTYNSGTLVYEQEVPLTSLSSSAWTWNNIALTTPVPIDITQELWFGVYMEYSGTLYYLVHNSTIIPNKSNLYSINDGSSWQEYSYGSYCLKATVEDIPMTVDHYQIDRNGSTIVANTTATSYSNNVGVNGNYNYTVWAIWSNGCQSGASGSVSVTGGCTTPGSVTTRNQCGGTYTWHGTTYNASGTYTYAFTNSSGCHQVDTLRLNIHSNPSVTISGSSSICSGASTTLTASGASTYSWSTGASGASISVHPTSTATYRVTGTNSYGCSATATFTVNVTSPTLASVTTSNVSGVTTSSATCGGTVSSDACSPVTARGVCWSTSHNPTVSGSHTTNGTGTGTFTSSLTGLATNTTYYVRAYATTAAGTAYGAEKSFTTGCGAITVTISGNNSICSGASATLTASGASTYSWSTGASGASISVHPTSTTTYTVSGTNSYGCSATATFTVNVTSPTLASVTTSSVSSVTTSTAICGGTVSSDACSPVTARGVCWSTSHNPTVSGSHTTNGTGTGTFTSSLTGLAVNTTYYVRAYATTAAGTAYGTERTFTTGCITAQGIQTVTACGSYTWHGHTYTASTNTPTYTITGGAANGCDSIVTLHLTIKPIPVVTISGNTSIHLYESTTLTASGASNYTWSTGSHSNAITVSPLVTTTYTVTGTTGGCTSAPASVTVTVGDCISAYHIETVTACDSYTWHGHTYTESTNTPTYTIPNGAANGCDSIVNLHLTIFHTTGSSLYISECGSYTWGGTTYTTSGIYTQEYSGPMGCPQVDTLYLTITPIPVVTISGDTLIHLHESTTILAFGAESYTWSNGLTSTGFVVFPTTTTTYTVTGYNGWCASAPVSITVHVEDCIPAQGIETVTACGSYTWHGHTYTSSTSSPTYTIPNGAANGCDSIVTLHLTIKPIPVVTISGNTSIHRYESTTLTAHGASSYTWSTGAHSSAISVSPTSTTTYSVTGYADGCTSIPASVTVTVGDCIPAQSIETATACNSYTWHGHTYTSSTNSPTFTIPNGAANGCDSIVTLHLTVNHPQHTAFTVSECGSYVWHGHTYTTSGHYIYSYLNEYGCTQVDTLHLTIKPVPVVTISGSTNIHLYESTTLTASGASSYVWSTGAHSSAITVSPASTTTYSVTGYTDGCASVPTSVSVYVGFCIPAQGVETVSACESYTWHGHTYTSSTSAPTFTIPNGAANGCDSIVTLHLTIYNPAPSTIFVTECGSYTWTDGSGQTYTQSGTYTYAHNDEYGCSQVDTLNLTIKPLPVVTITGNTDIHLYESTTLTAHGATSYIWSTGQSMTTLTITPYGTTTYTVTGYSDGCASIPASITVNVGDCIPAQGVETVVACESYTWHRRTYTESTNTPTFTIFGGATTGCDSIVTLHLTVHHAVHLTSSATACESYTWIDGNGHTYTQSGTYTYSHPDANECTQVDTLHLTIHNPTHISTTVSECGSYTWHGGDGQTYTASGTYTYTHLDAHGCTQVDTLHLTIRTVPVVTISGNTAIHLYESTTLIASGADTYLWSTNQTDDTITVAPASTTTYSVTGTSNGCNSQPASVTVTVGACIPAQGIETVTACESYTWHGHTYTESTNAPTFTIDSGAVTGCDSIVTLHLTVHHAVASTDSVTACDNYTWTDGDGQTYTESGTYTYSHQDANGCTQVDTLYLTINPTPPAYIMGTTSIHLYESTTLIALGGASYVWSTGETGFYITVAPTVTTTYSVTSYANGCASNPASVTVEVGPCIPAQSIEEITACESYTWHGHTYTESTSTPTYTYAGGAATGCDSIVTLHLTIHNPVHTAITVSECGQYTWTGGNGHTYTSSGTYTYSHYDSHGCTQVDTLHLTIKPIPVVTISGNNDIHLYESTTLTASGASTYLWSTNQTGSTITVAPAATTTYSVTGTTDGCASSPASITVTVGPCIPAQGIETITSCGSYTWHGHTYTASTTATHTIPNGAATGCDSIVTLHLTIHYPQHTALTVTECGSYTWTAGDGLTHTTSGNYLHSHTDANGCTQVDTLHLTIKPVPVVTISGNASIHLYESTTLTANGANSYSWSTGASNSAITVSPATTTTYSVTGTTDGCTSAPASVTVTVGPCIPAQGVETVTACGSYTWHGHTYLESTNTATRTFPNGAASGCDSIATLHLTVFHPQHTALTITECNSYTWTAGDGLTHTTSGNYLHSHTDANGCTQVDTLHLTVLHPQHTSLTVCECNNYTWTAGDGHTYFQSGDYLYSHTDANGCTQVDTLHLTIKPTPFVTITGNAFIHLYESTTLTAHGADSYVWSTGAHSDAITVSPSSATTYSVTGYADGCTSTAASITVNVGACIPAQGVETVTACGSYTWHGQTYFQSTSTATHTITNGAASGCDSIATLHLTVFHPQHTALTVTECGSYTWTAGDGQTHTTSGNYLHSHTDANGCMQVDTLHLTIHNPQHTALTVSECGSYTWTAGDGQTHTTSGNYLHSHTDANGCTQVDTLHLTIHNPQHTALTVSECGSYTWTAGDGQTYTTSGTYLHSHTDANGCTQVDTLHLTIHNPQHTSLTVSECDSYVWNGISYTTSGDHTFSHYDAGGCLQVDTLHLTIHHPQYSEFTVAIPDSCYTWNGTEYCENGDFSQTMTDQFGCDSTVTLHLTLRVGVTQYDEQFDITIYPNPTSSILYIESGAQISQLHLYNAFGQKIKSRIVNGTNGSLDLSDLATGTYYIRVETDKGVVVKKVIRNK